VITQLFLFLVFLPLVIMLNHSMLTTKLSAWEKISASVAAGKTMQGEAVEDEEQPYDGNGGDDFFLNQMDVDDEALQIQADFQPACERLRARAAKKMREPAKGTPASGMPMGIGRQIHPKRPN
jgi:hypothetical protein